MDRESLRSAFEFLSQKPIDDPTLNNILHFLPIPTDDLRLKKAMLFHKLNSQLTNASVSETVLELLEAIADLNLRDESAAIKDAYLNLRDDPVPQSPAIRDAYCAVAVDCAVRRLDGGENQEEEYFKAVKRFSRVLDLGKLEKLGLFCDELRLWKEDLQAAVWDSSVWEDLKARNRRNDAFGKVNACVSEALEGLKPWFVKLMESRVIVVDDDMEVELKQPPPASSPESPWDCSNVMQTGQVTPESKHAEKLVDMEESDARNFAMGLGFHPSPYINKMRDDLIKSCLELKAKAEDPLPAAIKLADEIIAKTFEENMRREPLVEGTSRVDSCLVHPAVDRSAETAQVAETAKVDPGNEQSVRTSYLEKKAVDEDPVPVASMEFENTASTIGKEGKTVLESSSHTPVQKIAEAAPTEKDNLDFQHCKNHNNLPKCSSMERNETAHTYEWDDSVCTSQPKDCPDHECTSKRKNFVCPPEKIEPSKEFTWRRKRRWSKLEEDTLTNGVQEYGEGNWKHILISFPEVFEGRRTAVDLKDKWRNLMRQRCNT